MFQVFVDGQEGTTGLQIHERLAKRSDIRILEIDPALRKDRNERARLLNAADVAFLCLPDDAAKESVSLVANDTTVIIDASTAHRVNPDWTYGLPELSQAQRVAISRAKRIANPGCHATGFALAVAPLVQAGALGADAEVCCYSITGYSGGGKKLIATYEAEGAQVSKPGASPALFAPQPYALALKHKHLPEMARVAGLSKAPWFNPILGPYYKGMAVTVPLFPSQLRSARTPAELHALLSAHYAGSAFVAVMPLTDNAALAAGTLDPTRCNDSNRAEIYVFGHGDHMQVSVVIDNLGKGASGAAIQNMNIVLGIDETEGL